jgi:hypothetical protein
MSPEQADLNQLDIDTLSDIYALGGMPSQKTCLRPKTVNTLMPPAYRIMP